MTDHDERVLRKCLDVYARRLSLPAVERFAERAGASRSFESDERLWQEIRTRFFADLTVDRLLEYALNCYRGCPEAGYCPPNASTRRAATLRGGAAMAYIYYLVREETPLTPFEFEEFKERFEEMLEKEPVPPTREDWDNLTSWLM